MMAQLAIWFDEGVKQGADYMIIVTDKFDWCDFPVYVTNGEEKDVHVVAQEHESDAAMTKVMEIYDLHGDKKAQLEAERTWAVERPPPSPSTLAAERLAAALKG